MLPQFGFVVSTYSTQGQMLKVIIGNDVLVPEEFAEANSKLNQYQLVDGNPTHFKMEYSNGVLKATLHRDGYEDIVATYEYDLVEYLQIEHPWFGFTGSTSTKSQDTYIYNLEVHSL